jgi:hypothetical protein
MCICSLWKRRRRRSFLVWRTKAVLIFNLYCCKCDCSEPDGTLKHLFLSQGNLTLLWLVLVSYSTYICNGICYCFVNCIKIAGVVSQKGLWKYLFLIHGHFMFMWLVLPTVILDAIFTHPWSILFIEDYSFNTSCNLIVEDLYYLLEGYLWRRCPV